MAKNAAIAFVQKVIEDEELRKKTANMKPEETVAFAKEMGYDFTAEELAEAVNEDIELEPEELGNAAGGTIMSPDAYNQYRSEAMMKRIKDTYCNADEIPYVGAPNITPQVHEYVKIGHIEEDGILWGTIGYDVYKCTLCGHEKKVHV